MAKAQAKAYWSSNVLGPLGNSTWMESMRWEWLKTGLERESCGLVNVAWALSCKQWGATEGFMVGVQPEQKCN